MLRPGKLPGDESILHAPLGSITCSREGNPEQASTGMNEGISNGQHMQRGCHTAGTAQTKVTRPSKIKIHAHPSLPPTPATVWLFEIISGNGNELRTMTDTES